MSLTLEAVVPQPSRIGQIVGVVLQNPTSNALASRYISFGMAFADGQVLAGQALNAEIGGSTEAVQMDVKTTYADGSVRFAVLTLLQPTIAANGSAPVMLARSPGGTPGAALDISALTQAAATYNVTVSLTNIAQSAYSSSSSTTPASTTSIPDVTVNVGQLLSDALSGASGSSLSYWQQGPLATQVRIDSGQIAGTPLHLQFDITLYADGSTSTQIGFNNDIAMQSALGTQPLSLTYDVSVRQNDAVALQQSNITQWQYQDWNTTLASNGPPQVNVQHDVAALEKTGAIQNYDLTTGVYTSLIAADTSRMNASASYGILGNGNIVQYMPQTGGRADIGPLPQWDTAWLLTQDPQAAAYALAQANEAGSIPWNTYDPTSNGPLTITRYPDLWTFGIHSYVTLLPQPAGATGWNVDPSHEPDLTYLAYLMTGNRTYLDQLNAEASVDETLAWPFPRQNAQGILAGAHYQLREQAWALREVVEAALVNPAGSAMKAYFTQLAANNFQYLLQQAESSGEGAVSGWFPSTTGAVPPWQEGYMISTLGLAAGLGIPGARQVLAWAANFVAGLFVNGANGYDPNNGVPYYLTMTDTSGAPLTSWAAVQQANTSLTGTLNTDTVYLALARLALSECITYLGSTSAIEAYGWLMAHAPALSSTISQDDPTFNVVPRLSDGNLLTNSNIFIRNDTSATPTVVTETNNDQLIYETGGGPVTLAGGSGINMLFGGSGLTTLVGGAASDDLFAGSGATTFRSGSGNDFMQAGGGGSGADTFVLSTGDIGHDIISGFRLGTDHLQVAGAAPGPTLPAVGTDGSGNAVILLSAGHSVTLQGIDPSKVTSLLFV